MNRASDHVSSVFDSSCHSGCDVLNRDGVYYARLALGAGEPVLIALHGISTETEARQALSSFSTLRPSPCCPGLTPA